MTENVVEIPGEHIESALRQGALTDWLEDLISQGLSELSGIGHGLTPDRKLIEQMVDQWLFYYTPSEDERERSQFMGVRSFVLDSAVNTLRQKHGLIISGDGRSYKWANTI